MVTTNKKKIEIDKTRNFARFRPATDNPTPRT